MENYFNEIREIYLNYSNLRDELADLEKRAAQLNESRMKIGKELENNRFAERVVINKLEESLNRKITQDDLIQIIKNHEN
jgi:hypothetical protein